MEYTKSSSVPRRHFAQHVDLRSRKAMAAFLGGHFRYPTANAWNLSTSYACNMKITSMGLPAEITGKLLELAETEEFYDRLSELVNKFSRDHGYKWQPGWNGRSGGYLVLYQGGTKPSEHKSICTSCGQRNFRTVEETGPKCGRCGKDARVDFTPADEVFAYPCRGTDMDMGYDEFIEMPVDELRDRTRLVREFDTLADRIAEKAIRLALTCEARDQTVFVPQTRRVMKKTVKKGKN